MVTAAIVICALVYAFFDKPHLLQKPIKADKIIIIAVLILTAGLSYTKEYFNQVQQDKDSTVIDSLQGESKALLRQVDTLRSDNKIALKEYTSGLLGYHTYTTELLARYGIKVDTLTNTIRRLNNSGSKEVLPTLAIFETPEIGNTNGETVFVYELESINSETHLISYDYTLINPKDGKTNGEIDEPIKFGGASMNLTTIIAPTDRRNMSIFMNRDIKFKNDCYLAMEFKYQSKGNIEQPPLRKVYYIHNNKTKVSEVTSETFVEISNILHQNKIW
jgi:hypothetical protein